MERNNLNLESSAGERGRFVEHGRPLEYFTIFWNSLEALAALIAGFMAESVALVGFGLDSLIEVTSGAALLRRPSPGQNCLAARSGSDSPYGSSDSCFLMLSAYIPYDSLDSLLRKEVPARSLPGIVIAMVSLIAMPLLSRAKRRVGLALGSAARAADARQTDFCTLSVRNPAR